MTIFKDISIIWAMFHSLILFILLFESKYSFKKTLRFSCSTMIPLIIVNTLLFIFMDYTNYTKVMLLTCSLPSLLFFFLLAKHRDGRFVFTFCLADTLVIEILYIIALIDYFVPIENGIFMLVACLIAYPALEFFIYRYVRSSYLEVQNHVASGWYLFAIIGGIFYVLITLSFAFPSMITRRPEYIPALVLIFILMPAVYTHILTTLNRQKKIYELTEQDNILKLQVTNLTERMQELNAADDKFRMERHNMRHKMLTIAGMLEKQEYERLYDYVEECNEAIQDTKVKRYCSNPVIDAVLASYLQKAEQKGISVYTQIVFPDPLPVNETELATVFANAIENATNACENLPAEERSIDVKVLTSPCFMLQISNRFDEAITFDESGVPVSHQKNHGFGTKSIVAFCEKHNAFYEFHARDHIFSLRINFDH